MTDPTLRRVLELRLATSQAATAKYKAILSRQVDGRVLDQFVYCGASRTGRWSGRGAQPQNLKRPPKGQDNDAVAESLIDGTFDAQHGGDNALKTLGGAIRAAITAKPGHRLVVCDLASIESRALGWVSGDGGINGIFAARRDPYKDFAARWFRKRYEDVTKEERTLSKPPTLGCGYGLSAKGLVEYAYGMGVKMTYWEAKSAVDTFRKSYPAVPAFWKWCEAAFRRALTGEVVKGYRLVVQTEGDMLTVRLPSGRKLYYKNAALGYNGLQYSGMGQFTHKWGIIRTYGARITENIIQAIARDILAHGMRLAHRDRMPIVLHAHDEIGIEVPEEHAEKALEHLRNLMTTVPVWATGLLLGAEGYIAKRYRKD